MKRKITDDEALDVGDHLVQKRDDRLTVAPMAGFRELYLEHAIQVELHVRLKLLAGAEGDCEEFCAVFERLPPALWEFDNVRLFARTGNSQLGRRDEFIRGQHHAVFIDDVETKENPEGILEGIQPEVCRSLVRLHSVDEVGWRLRHQFKSLLDGALRIRAFYREDREVGLMSVATLTSIWNAGLDLMTQRQLVNKVVQGTGKPVDNISHQEFCEKRNLGWLFQHGINAPPVRLVVSPQCINGFCRGTFTEYALQVFKVTFRPSDFPAHAIK